MRRPPPRSNRTDTILPNTTPFRSAAPAGGLRIHLAITPDEHPSHTGRADWYHQHDGAALHQHDGAAVPQHEGAAVPQHDGRALRQRSAEHTSELQSLMRISYAVFCL